MDIHYTTEDSKEAKELEKIVKQLIDTNHFCRASGPDKFYVSREDPESIIEIKPASDKTGIYISKFSYKNLANDCPKKGWKLEIDSIGLQRTSDEITQVIDFTFNGIVFRYTSSIQIPPK